jgi:putative phosphoribosyl transferase
MRVDPETAQERTVFIDTAGVELEGGLVIPEQAYGIVLFAHGSGSSRHSPRNRFVADWLHSAGLATLLMDLLTSEEEQMDDRTGRLRFDIELLADRLCGAVEWLADFQETRNLRIGIFGASTGGGAAAVAAARKPGLVRAVVSRGGRPDLAGSSLQSVLCPTLLIVGGNDRIVINLNREALSQLLAPVKELAIVPGATHLFEEPGTLEQVARLAADWFRRYLAPVAPSGEIGHAPSPFRRV